MSIALIGLLISVAFAPSGAEVKVLISEVQLGGESDMQLR